jgi:hypothetical protein
MKYAPTRSAIFTAEQKLAQSRRDTAESFHRARSALRSKLERPSSLALAAGLAVLIGFWLVRRKPRTTRAGGWGSTSMVSLAIGFLVRFGWQRFSGFLRDSWTPRQERPATGAPLPDEHLKGLARQR